MVPSRSHCQGQNKHSRSGRNLWSQDKHVPVEGRPVIEQCSRRSDDHHRLMALPMSSTLNFPGKQGKHLRASCDSSNQLHETRGSLRYFWAYSPLPREIQWHPACKKIRHALAYGQSRHLPSECCLVCCSVCYFVCCLLCCLLGLIQEEIKGILPVEVDIVCIVWLSPEKQEGLSAKRDLNGASLAKVCEYQAEAIRTWRG
jgi:hypothetical protein